MRRFFPYIYLSMSCPQKFSQSVPKLFFNKWLQTKKAMKFARKSWKISNELTILQQGALLYTNLGQAKKTDDLPLALRSLTPQMFQKWKEEPFTIYDMVYRMKMLKCRIIQHDFGTWMQCRLQMTHYHEKNYIKKNHTIECRCEQNNEAPIHRKWVYSQFEN